MNKQTDNKIIAVYGSLRKSHGNWRALLNYEPIKTEVVEIPFKMISLGSFPGLVPSDDLNQTTIELYDVNQNTYNRIQQLEGFPSFYQKALVPTTLGEVEIYVLEDPRYRVDPTYVESGDWNEYYTKRYEYQD
jgi:gamma-glutamylcyclotransferase (GGCT)/AIG2-like uncharacterized protein YtfP